jgi:Tfp pilus assembly protein PilV
MGSEFRGSCSSCTSRPTIWDNASSGFTFLELLIATAIITAIGVALVSAQTAAVRASQTAREINELTYEARRVQTETHLGFGPEKLENLESGPWSFSEQPSLLSDGTNTTFWHHWRITRAATGTPTIEFTLRAPTGPRR